MIVFYDLIMRYNRENLKFRMIRIKQIVKSFSVSFIVSITDIGTDDVKRVYLPIVVIMQCGDMPMIKCSNH